MTGNHGSLAVDVLMNASPGRLGLISMANKWTLVVRGHNAESGTRMLVNRIRALAYEAGISDRFDASVAMSAPLTERSY